MQAIDVVKKFYEAFGAGKLDEAFSLLDEDVRWLTVGPSSIPYFGDYTGRAGVEAFFTRLFEVEEILEFEPQKFIAEGSNVVVLGREKCRVKATGNEFSSDWVQIFEVKNGRIKFWKEFIDSASLAEAYGSASV